MITAELQGKLGNMMFQIAAIENMGLITGLKTAYPNVNTNIDDLRKPQACSSEYNGYEYFKLFKNFNWHKNHDGDTHHHDTVNVPFHYVKILPKDYTKYLGYFQSEKNFPNRDFTLNLFQPNDTIQKKLDTFKDLIGENKASLHVRRGDYVRLSNIYRVLGEDYYRTAINHLGKYGVKEYVIFSNDIKWCKDTFVGKQFTIMEEDSFTELFLMGKCAHNVIANSAFSWWGAYLNDKEGRCVIAPRKWFSTTRMIDRDIVPHTWMKI